MSDRYQPGSSTLSFLNPGSMYYSENINTVQNHAKSLSDAVKIVSNGPFQNQTKLEEVKQKVEEIQEIQQEVPADKPIPVVNIEPQPTADVPESLVEQAAEVQAEQAQAEAIADVVTAESVLPVAEGSPNAPTQEGFYQAVQLKQQVSGSSECPCKKQRQQSSYCPCEQFKSSECPCAKQFNKPCPCRKKSIVNDLKHVAGAFVKKESFIVADSNGAILPKVQKTGLKVKGWLTGAGKYQKSNFEAFCADNWTEVSSSLLTLLTVLTLLIAIMILFGFVRLFFCGMTGKCQTNDSTISNDTPLTF